MIYALINKKNIIVNTIVYDNKSNYEPPKGLKLVEIVGNKNIGDKYTKTNKTKKK